MLTAEQQKRGSGSFGWLRTTIKSIFCSQMVNDEIEGQNQDTYFEGRQELIADSATVPGGKTDYSPTGTPTFAIVTNGVGGQVTATLPSDNAGMVAGISWKDNLQLKGNRSFRVSHRVKTAIAPTTAEYVLIGVSGALESGFAPVTLAGLICGAFYLDASLVLNTLTRDGTTNTTYVTGRTLTADTWYWFTVEKGEDGYLRYYLGEQYGEDGALLHEINADFGTSQCLQPIAVQGKASGVTTPAIAVDTQKWQGHRSA